MINAHYKNNLKPFGGYHYEKSIITSSFSDDGCWFIWLFGPTRRN
ncbi:hypothetical protein CRENPOLYSF2_3220002 [Crenothrix polyspora]|uniref:Uncharacterized protein n=1 Tax=Crenothrix polyspora TaxID=360316 RepID=A0A1R4HAV0_9GAMM|nr:hypothetical protein CRENPOLYSF2_3220002 [Crenothrix polyspora]